MANMSLRLSEDAVRGFYPMQSSQPGAPIVPLGHRRDGRPIFPIMGGAEEPDEDDDQDDEDDDADSDDEDDDSDDDDEDDDKSNGPEGKKSKSAKKPEGDPQRKIAALEDEKNRLYRGRKKARDERDELQSKYDKLVKDGQGDESLKTKVSELEASNQKMSSELSGARMKIAFLSDNSYEWQSPGLALKAADLSDVEIDDDGQVHGLKAALEKLATENPFLLKQAETKKRKPANSGTATGKPPASNSSKSKEKSTKEQLRAKYAGLKR